MATITSLLQDHVTLEVRSVDRIFLHAYVPRLQTQYQVIRFLLDRGYPIPSPAALGRIGKAFVRDIERFCSERGVPVVRFRKKDDQEQTAAPYFAQASEQGRYGVVMLGVRQETANVWTGWREGGSDAHPHFEYSRQSKFVNHYYVYILDRQFGPVFFKIMAYAPYSVWIWCNANEWAKCQADQAGIAYTALDNGFAACSDPAALQRICDRFSAAAIRTLCERWLRRLPSPFTAEDPQRGYWYDYAFRQFEVSDTRMFDRPASARAWFEGTIKEHLDLGRPDRVSVVFNRRINRRTPGRFSTRVITQGVDPSIYIKYKASKLKQYMKLGRALRTETVINNTRDFGIGRRVTEENLQALRAVGEAANRRLIELEVSSSPCAPDADTLRRVVLPSIENGLPGGSPKVRRN